MGNKGFSCFFNKELSDVMYDNYKEKTKKTEMKYQIYAKIRTKTDVFLKKCVLKKIQFSVFMKKVVKFLANRERLRYNMTN